MISAQIRACYSERIMQKVTAARNLISPLLDALIQQLESEGRLTHRAHFKRIQLRLSAASNELDLTFSMYDLSSSQAIGFQFSTTAEALVSTIQLRADQLVASITNTGVVRH